MNSKLQKAIEQGDLQAAIAALDRGADIEAADMHGDPGLPLRTACFMGHTSIVVELLKRGANVRAPNADGSDAPVRIASRARHAELVHLLIQHGAEKPAEPPALLAEPEVQPATAGERRRRAERRKGNQGPPTGLKDRRNHEERRVTSVQELELSDFQWTSYFSQSKTQAVQQHDVPDLASLVLERVRD